MEGKSCEDRLRYLGLWTLEERRNRQDLIELFKIVKGLSLVRIEELFMLDENTKGTRSHCLQLNKTQHTRDITRHFYPVLRASYFGPNVLFQPEKDFMLNQ